MTAANELDRKLTNLLRDDRLPDADPAFADRIVALAAHDLQRRNARARLKRRFAIEGVGLAGAVATFALLSLMGGNVAGAGDSVPLTSPAMMGVLTLSLWLLATVRPATAR